jgi:hypothetical protein
MLVAETAYHVKQALAGQHLAIQVDADAGMLIRHAAQ